MRATRFEIDGLEPIEVPLYSDLPADLQSIFVREGGHTIRVHVPYGDYMIGYGYDGGGELELYGPQTMSVMLNPDGSFPAVCAMYLHTFHHYGESPIWSSC